MIKIITEDIDNLYNIYCLLYKYDVYDWWSQEDIDKSNGQLREYELHLAFDADSVQDAKNKLKKYQELEYDIEDSEPYLPDYDNRAEEYVDAYWDSGEELIMSAKDVLSKTDITKDEIKYYYIDIDITDLDSYDVAQYFIDKGKWMEYTETEMWENK